MSVHVRAAIVQDAPEMASLLNEIIALGGTTAYEEPFDPDRMQGEYISGENVISCVVADDGARILGFQGLFSADPSDSRMAGWGNIATFARVGNTGAGVGRALFAETLRAARRARLVAINATIRADNVPGLAFYSRLGFDDYDRLVGVPLADGTLVDRIKKRFDIGDEDGTGAGGRA